MLKKFMCIFIVLVVSFNANTTLVSAEGELDLKAKANILIDAGSGKVLYEKNSDEKLAIASVTKIMTMLLVMEAVDSGRLSLDDIVVASERAKSMGGSTIFLDTGEEMTVNDLMKGIAVASGNDACVAVAEHIAGSVEGFVDMMNKRAAELGMTNTSFKNTNGLDAEGHYSSAADVAKMSAELLKHEKIFDYTTIWMDSLRNGAFQLANTNKLIRYYKDANGLKTGSTDEALYCVSGAAKRDGLQLIAVVLGAPTSAERFSDASKLLDYGFANYAIKEIVAKDVPMGEVTVVKGMEQKVKTKTADGYSALYSKNASLDAEKEVVLSEYITAPVKAGDKVGEIRIKDGEGEAVVDIVACEDVKKINYGAMLKRICATMFSMLG